MRDSIRADAARPRASTTRRAPQLPETRGVDRLATAAQDGALPDTLARLLAPGAGALRGPVSRALQQTHGNRAVTRMVQAAANARTRGEHATPAGIEARRAMGDDDAHHERQADRAADAAMRRLGSAPPPPEEPAAPPTGDLGRPLSFPIRRRFENAFGWDFSDAEAAGEKLRIPVKSVSVRAVADFAGAFAAMARDRVDAVFVHGSALTARHNSPLLAQLALKHRLPSMFQVEANVQAGGLMCYAPDLLDLTRRSAVYIDKILKGAKPADLPVEQASKYELVINLKTAKALGLTIPPSLLLRADQLIE
jgi:hypothetical protein